MAYKATYRFARISARKVRPLADLIRGKHADEALDILRYSRTAARGCWKRCSKAPWATPKIAGAEPAAPDGDRLPGRRRADVQADAAACPGHGVRDPQADGAHSRRTGITRTN